LKLTNKILQKAPRLHLRDEYGSGRVNGEQHNGGTKFFILNMKYYYMRMVVFMGIITVKLSDDIERLLREEAFRRFGGKRGGISRIVEEAIIAWLGKSKESVRVYRIIIDGKIAFESSDLDDIARFLRERNLTPRDVRILILPRKREYRVGPRGVH